MALFPLSPLQLASSNRGIFYSISVGMSTYALTNFQNYYTPLGFGVAHFTSYCKVSCTEEDRCPV